MVFCWSWLCCSGEETVASYDGSGIVPNDGSLIAPPTSSRPPITSTVASYVVPNDGSLIVPPTSPPPPDHLSSDLIAPIPITSAPTSSRPPTSAPTSSSLPPTSSRSMPSPAPNDGIFEFELVGKWQRAIQGGSGRIFGRPLKKDPEFLKLALVPGSAIMHHRGSFVYLERYILPQPESQIASDTYGCIFSLGGGVVAKWIMEGTPDEVVDEFLSQAIGFILAEPLTVVRVPQPFLVCREFSGKLYIVMERIWPAMCAFPGRHQTAPLKFRSNCVDEKHRWRYMQTCFLDELPAYGIS